MILNKSDIDLILRRRDIGLTTYWDTPDMVDTIIAMQTALEAWVKWYNKQTHPTMIRETKSIIELTHAAGVEWPEAQS